MPALEVELPQSKKVAAEETEAAEPVDNHFLKTRIEDLDFSPRVAKSLAGASIRTVGGLSRKRQSDLAEISGLGEKGIEEIKEILGRDKITLKD